MLEMHKPMTGTNMRSVMKRTHQFLDSSTLGVFGVGHFGRAIARGLLDAGFPRSKLRICHRGSADTRRQLADLGLSDCLTDRHELVRDSKIVLYAVRPQDYRALADCRMRADGLLVSFLAGVPLTRLPVSLSEYRRVRVTTSSPHTLQQRNGIAAIYPAGNDIVLELLSALSLRVFALEHETDMDAFTAFATCLPTALAYWEAFGHQVEADELLEAAARHRLSDYPQVLAWARAVQPRGLAPAELDAYITQAATPGGVTETILREIEAGKPLSVALECGVKRSRKLGSEPESRNA